MEMLKNFVERLGAEISTFKTTDLSLGVSQNVNPNTGRKERFAVFKVQQVVEVKLPGFGIRTMDIGTPKSVIKFEDELGYRYTILEKYVDQTKTDAHGGHPVVLSNVLTSDDVDTVLGLLYWPGGKIMKYYFKKGACYANDVNGKRSTDKFGQPIVQDSVNVFCQIERQYINNDGEIITEYTSGMSPDEVGGAIERRLWREAVNGQADAAVFSQPASAVQPQSQAPVEQAQPTQQQVPPVAQTEQPPF